MKPRILDKYILLSTNSPCEKAIPRNTLKRLIAKTSSQEEAAITKVGMPSLVPYPAICKLSIEGTTTAGETAPSMNLKTTRVVDDEVESVDNGLSQN